MIAKKNWRMIGAAAVLGTVAGVASAQTTCPAPDNCLTNPGFEVVNAFNAAEPFGWHNASNPGEAKRRLLDDGLLPTAVTHSGLASISIATPGNGSEFRSFNTDTVNFYQAGFPFFDPAYDWAAHRDIRVSGWYYIPTTDPIFGDSAGIKLEIKALNQPFATNDPWGGEAPTIQGDTGNEWMYYEYTWTGADILAEVEANGELGIIPYPANTPNRLKVTLGRWAPFDPASGGVIFWDDVKLEYIDAGPTCPVCAADFDDNGGIDGADLAAFFTAYESGTTCADVDQNGGIDGADLAAFFTAYEAGGC